MLSLHRHRTSQLVATDLRPLFYLVPLLLALGLAMQVQGLWEFNAMWHQGMDINADEVVITSLLAIVQLVTIIGLLRRRPWAKTLSYVLFSLMGVAVLLLFLNAAFGGALETARQFWRVFALTMLYVCAAGICIWLVKREYDAVEQSPK